MASINRPFKAGVLKKILSFSVCCFFCSLSANAQSFINATGDSTQPRIYANAGIFFPNLTTSLRVDSQRGPGTDLSLEDDFNFDQSLAVVHVQAIVRAKQRSQFAFSFTNINRSSNLVVDQEFSFADTAFYIGADLNLRFDVNYYAFTWRYSFFNHATWNAGLSLGLRAAQFGAEANAVVNGEQYGAADRVIAPTILIGLHGSGYLTHRLLGRYSLEYFGLNVAGFDIQVLETRASLEYFITKNIGLGVAYSTSSYRVADFPLNNNFKGRVLFDFSGGNLFLCARF